MDICEMMEDKVNPLGLSADQKIGIIYPIEIFLL